MRIWAFPSFYPYEYPGEKWKGIFAHRQYKGLIENGADLKVIVPVKQKPIYPIAQLSAKWSTLINYPASRVYDGIEVYHPRIANFLPHSIDKRTYKDKFCDAVAGFFREQKIVLSPATDIFFSQWLPEAMNVQYTAHKLGVRSAILYIGDDVVVWPNKDKIALEAFDELLTTADMRFACADYLGKEANRLIGKDLSYDVVNWGVDYNHFKPATAAQKKSTREKYKLPQDKLLILNVGSAITRKGWLDFFDAVSKIKTSADNFKIVGVHSGFADLDLDAEAAKRNIGDLFINMGEVPPEALNELYGAVDIFCLPSHWEGLANANIEAMSSGLPVITTNVCGHPELIDSGVNGLLIPPKDAGILAETLLSLIKDSDRRIELGNTARKFIINKWGNFADNAALLYKKLSED